MVDPRFFFGNGSYSLPLRNVFAAQTHQVYSDHVAIVLNKGCPGDHWMPSTSMKYHLLNFWRLRKVTSQFCATLWALCKDCRWCSVCTNGGPQTESQQMKSPSFSVDINEPGPVKSGKRARSTCYSADSEDQWALCIAGDCWILGTSCLFSPRFGFRWQWMHSVADIGVKKKTCRKSLQ